jgi:N-glycosylase/DNA lyase
MELQITEQDRIEAKKAVDRFKGEKTAEQIFYNLCFALLAPQTTFKNNKKVIALLEEKKYFSNNIPKEELEEIVRPTRFFRNKTRFLTAAKANFEDVLGIINLPVSVKDKRRFLVESVNGLGMKASSHFMRNLGYTDLAIIDTHILKFLNKNIPKNNNEYIEIEKELTNFAEDNDISMAELDAIIWKYYSDTNWEDFDY